MAGHASWRIPAKSAVIPEAAVEPKPSAQGVIRLALLCLLGFTSLLLGWLAGLVEAKPTSEIGPAFTTVEPATTAAARRHRGRQAPVIRLQSHGRQLLGQRPRQLVLLPAQAGELHEDQELTLGERLVLVLVRQLPDLLLLRGWKLGLGQHPKCVVLGDPPSALVHLAPQLLVLPPFLRSQPPPARLQGPLGQRGRRRRSEDWTSQTLHRIPRHRRRHDAIRTWHRVAGHRAGYLAHRRRRRHRGSATG
mmetsp:Transcript_34099/g.74510  ORF Transcript_34099/g.74510 Transcript_34099/m.74510 type:complete len:249 (-) Transcript_34099:50-796(-)